jgi:hypothetical protein
MSLHRTIRYSLIIPMLLLTVAYLFSLAIEWQTRSADWHQLGIAVLGIVAVFATLIELIAVPVSLYLLFTDPRYHTAGNIALTASGMLPIGLLALIAICVLYGHR